MKKNILNTLLLGACVVSLTACDDNSWNDNLDGFDGNTPITEVKTIDYTLTDADYSAIAKNSTNIALAGEELANALKAVGNQHYFTPEIQAKDYIPAFLGSTSFPYFILDDGSSVKVTYKITENLPVEVSAIAAAMEYNVTTDNYKSVWGSDDDYIAAFAPSHSAEKSIPGILTSQYPEAQAGQYAIVNYKASYQEPVFGNAGDVSYTHMLTTQILSGRKYMFVADGKAAMAIDESKGYGYLNVTTVGEDDGTGLNVAESAALEFRFVSTEGGYYIIDCYGRYMYMTGSFNSFNLSTELPESGAVWTVAANEDGTMVVTNVEMGKTIQYSAQYSSYGVYPEVTGVYPKVYERLEPYTHVKTTVVNDGASYIMSAEGNAAKAIDEGKGYGYLNVMSVGEDDGTGLNVAESTALEFRFVSTEGGYHIIDCYGRYMYMTGSFNSFNLSTELPESGAVWTVAANEDGTMVVANVEMGKTIQYSAQYSSYGVYPEVTGIYPIFYENVYSVSSVKTQSLSRAALAMVPTTDACAVYAYDGSEWSLAEGVKILQPADYVAMGQSYGN
ncbi:MAG: hypothetical protein IJZ17_06950, partial [Muribaculaceae bacterium]|nr:hypothetical protein [Muribaculaceae bacterium]